jgi:UDP-N-acetylmuramyl pentapeptide phosphotransferase/UDP-N-acetylglucosamine-1-phosphate transferase
MAARLAHASLAGMPHAQSALWSALVVAGCAGLSALLIYVLRPILVRHLLAHPNARSSHTIATPQGAGLAVMASVFAACALGILLWGQGSEPRLLGVLVAAAGLTLLGAIDDAHTLSVWSRLGGQFLAALIVVGTLPEDLRLFPGLMPAGVEDALMVFGLMWFVNAVNFLDGLDWMTVAQVVPITLGIAVLYALGAVPDNVGLLALALLGATLGFAIFNKHPAQIFLGDAGSLPIGLCLAFMLIFVAHSNLAAALLLSLYTLADPTLTLFRRMARKEPILSAHRTHFYQRGVAAGLSVQQVTTRIFLLSFMLAALAVATVLADSLAVDLLCIGLGAAATTLTLFALAKGRRE